MDESSLSGVADNLGDLLLIMEQNDIPIKLREQTKKLRSKLMELSCFFNKHYGNETLVADAAAVTSAAFKAQVIISDFVHDYIRKKQTRRFNKAIFFRDDLEIKEMLKLTEHEQVIFNRRDTCSSTTATSNPDDSTTAGGESHDDDDDDILFVGREEDIQAIQEKLISAEADNMFCIISIVGMAGSGKTCLARKVYNSQQVRTHFDCLVWICAQQSDSEKLLKAIAEQVMGRKQLLLHLQENKETWSVLYGEAIPDSHRFIKETILDFLREKRYLIVIDDILEETWSVLYGEAIPDSHRFIKETILDFLREKRYLIVIDDILEETWSDLYGAFPSSSANGSRILLTTCDTTRVDLAAQYRDKFWREVWKGPFLPCRDPHPPKDFLDPYQLGPLNDAESWELFSKKVTLPLDFFSSYKNEIVKKCDGLPLAILRLASLLSKENKNINTTDHANHDQGFQLVLDSIVDTDDCLGRPWTSHIVDTIVSDLPSHLKRCLLYFRYFPKYSKIPTRRLIALWVAEGLVEETSGSEPEVVAEGYLEQLIKRNMIEVVKYSSNQRPKKCCLTYSLREHLLITTALSKQQNQASSSSSSSSRSTKVGFLRLADHAHNDEVIAFPEHNKSQLLSFLSFDYREGPAPGERVGKFLSEAINKGCFRLLRVLDLERVYKPVLPKEIGRLIHLRYLGLRWTYLDTLPSSILNLKNLQTLDIKHTYINTLPEPLSDMFSLRHLYLNETQLAQSQCMPRDLQTLWGIFLSEDRLDKFLLQSKVTQLGLVCYLPLNSDQEEMARCIWRQNQLQKLRFTSIDQQYNKPSLLKLEHFTNHKDLSDLNLLGKLEKLLMLHEFPPNLTELTLSASNLKEDPMPTLEKLSKLTILKLYADTFLGKRMVCSSSGFIQLEVLKIWKLKELEEWDVKEGSMPVLKKLEIRSCNCLSKLPDRFQKITTLVELKISDMPTEFTVMVKQNKDTEWYKRANVCFIDWETRNSSIEAASSSSSSTSSSSPSASILLLFFLLGRVSASPTKHSTRVQGLPALGCVRH